MNGELFYIIAVRDDAVLVSSTKDSGKAVTLQKSEMYRITDTTFIGGAIKDGFYPCLYSKSLNRFYSNLYRASSKVLYQLHPDGQYTEIHSRLNLPVCDVFALSDRFIIVGDDNAFVTNLNCTNDNFTGLVFDYVVWDNKLFLQAQTFKLYGDGLYFVYNIVCILKSDLSLFSVYETDLSEVRALERKYDLHPQANTSRISPADLAKIHNSLQLYNLNKQTDGVYLDDVKIYS